MGHDTAQPTLLEAMRVRLRQLAEFWEISGVPEVQDPLDELPALLRAVLARVQQRAVDSELWLAFVATSGAYPGVGDMRKLIALRDSSTPGELWDWFVPASAAPAEWSGGALGRLRFIEDQVVVDVHSCATSDRHTGIQRVERETIPRWTRDHELLLVAWAGWDGWYRPLDPDEEARVLAWKGKGAEPPRDRRDDDLATEILVPVGCTIVLPEVADARKSSRLDALARYSGNRLTAIGYDVIPLTSPDLLPRDSGTDFLDYLVMLRNCEVIAGISRSATEEFRGFLSALGADEGTRTRLAVCELPTDVPSTRAPHQAGAGSPLVLCVGSHEPRKNHGTVLFAAESLWREGLDFTLEFIGGGGWGTDFDEQAEQLIRHGRPLKILKAVGDAALWDAYHRARFTMFPSLHEGYGLPVAESLAFGTPVVTTDYGSTAEIAERGGCLTVDPRSDDAVRDAMRALLVDDELHARLSAEASRISLRSWDEYAAELWGELVSRG